jgi:hypothetical protein
MAIALLTIGALAVPLGDRTGWHASIQSRSKHSRVLWKSDFETGTYVSWGDNGGYGGHEDTGDASSTVDSTHAHSGEYSLKMTTDTATGKAGARNFRWAIDFSGTPLPKTAYYTAWFYWERNYAPPVWWNIFGFKTKNGSGGSDPDWSINVYNDGKGMRLYWYDFHAKTDHGINSGAGSLSLHTWHKIETKYTWDIHNGSVVSWLDGVKWFSLSHVPTEWQTTAINPGIRQFSVKNYTDKNIPAISNIWVDDVSIGKTLTSR